VALRGVPVSHPGFLFLALVYLLGFHASACRNTFPHLR
jgi:hypothetical protein